MRRRHVLLPLLLAVVGPAPAAAATCSKPAARAAIRATPAAAALRATLDGPYGGIAQLWCRDLTRDGRRDMTVTVTGGGTAGITGWATFRAVKSPTATVTARDSVVDTTEFRQVAGRWRLALVRADRQHVRLRITRRHQLWEQYPVYRDADPGCCPTGGYVNRRFRWTGTRFVVARRWHTDRAG